MTDVETFSKTYQRGHRHVFSSHGVKGAMLSSSAIQVEKGKDKSTEPIIDELEDKHETEQEFQLIDLDDEDEVRITNALIRRKEAKISELQYNIHRAQYVFGFLEQENQQLKTNQIISEVNIIKAKKEAERAKALLEETLGRFGEIDDEEDQPPRQRPKTRVLKRALARER